MKSKKHVHKVTINDKRRQNKKRSDMSRKGAQENSFQLIFDKHYRGPLKALYRRIIEQ